MPGAAGSWISVAKPPFWQPQGLDFPNGFLSTETGRQALWKASDSS